MKKSILLLFISFLFSCSLWAQNTNDRYKELASENSYRDVAYLKNGSIIRGFIIEQSPGVSIKLLTRDNNVFVFKMDELDKLTREKRLESEDVGHSGGNGNYNNNGNNNGNYNGNNNGGRGPRYDTEGYYQAKTSGFAYLLNIGTSILIGANDGSAAVGLNSTPAFSFSQLIGGRVRPKLVFGWETGIDYANVSGADLLFFNTGMGLHAGLMKTRVEPTIDWDLGYSMQYTAASIDHGIHITFAPGLKVWVTPKVALNFKVGYRYIGIYSTGSIETNHVVPIMFGVEF